MNETMRPERVRDGERTAGAAELAAENARLSEMLGRAQLGLNAIGDAVVATNAAGRIDYVNAAAERLCGFGLRELRGLRADQVFSLRSAQTRARLVCPIRRCLIHGRRVSRPGCSLLVVSSGHAVMVQETATPVRDARGRITGAVMVLRDLSLQTDLSERLAWQQRHDPLTGLVNRDEFERRLGREISLLADSGGRRHTLLYLDLDRFRVINDLAGHDAGDRALLEVARLIQEQIRDTDLAARLGGDEFAVLLLDCDTRDGVAVARQIGGALERRRFRCKQGAFCQTASIGVVGVAAGGTTGGVLADADVACYAAKESGRNTVSRCTAERTSGQYRDLKWVGDIGRAFDEGRFQLYCQPIVAIGGNKSCRPHFELLLRINDSERGVIPASEFLPVAERFNLMPAVDRWVLRHTLQNLVRLRGDESSFRYMLSVNLSGTSLSDNEFLKFARAELENAGIAEQALCFEITETAAIDNIEAVARFMLEMRKLGCAFSLDDFGSGLSSFAYLKALPVDFLKIDGRFIRHLHEDAVDHTMVGAIGHIGSAIGVRTVAERVESSETLAQLESLGIDFAQGYYFARPAPVRDRACFSRLPVPAW